MEGVRAIRPGDRVAAAIQTPGMRREEAIGPTTTGSESLWVGLVTAASGNVSGWHHHGDCETGIYVVQGRTRFRWGPGGKGSVEVGPGDFVAVAPGAIHREETAMGEDGVFVVARSGSGILTVNVEGPEPE